MNGKAKYWFVLGLMATFLLILPFHASAGQDAQKEILELKRRIEQLEKRVEQNEETSAESEQEWKELRAVKEKFSHISIGGGVTGIVQNAYMEDDWEDDDALDGSYSADLEIEIDLDRWGTGFLHLESGDGDNVTDEIGSLTGSNADAMGGMDSELEISEALWSFGFLDERLRLTAGKLDPVTLLDDNRVAKDETTQFMADIFVDQLAMEWPGDYSPGLQLVAAPNELFDFKAAVLSADTDWEDLANHMFYAAEIAFHPEFNDLEGNYRFYGWGNDRHHLEWNDAKALISGGPADDADEANFGFGVSFDQRLSSDITLFARYGWQDDDIAAVQGAAISDDNDGLIFEPYGAIEQSFSLGGEITGRRWNRPDDRFGMAFGMAMLNDDYEDFLENYAHDRLVDGTRGDAGDEYHFEAYYSYYLNEHLAVSPDFQIIANPRGDEDADAAYIVGLRTQMSF
ncbi:MAG: carbohydrate porin [Desulfosalsimonadaceae bacterium]